MVVFFYILLVNNFLGNVDKTIHADGVGYYDYLPSIFIHHDFVRKDKSIFSEPESFERIKDYADYKEGKILKYGCGTAILEAPFFAYALATTPLEGNANDGYQASFHKAIFHAAIFYLFLSLLLLRKILEGYEIRGIYIFLIQLLLVLGTSVTHYANADAGYSHVYSLFAIAAFIHFIRAYFQHFRFIDFLGVFISFALILLIRQVNSLIILFVPFLADSFPNFKLGIVRMLSEGKALALGLVILLGAFALQSLLWYLQVGEFFIYSYGNERFYFAEPEIFNILFSYRKGLFVYTPILLIALSGLVWMLFSKQYFKVIAWLLPFAILTYILSSWWSWYYGCSYGLRAYLEYFPFFFLPFALMLARWKSKAKYLLLLAAFACVPLNLIQSYQYKYCILHWDEMDEGRYWDVFLQMEDKYKGIHFKNRKSEKDYEIVRRIELGSLDEKAPNQSVVLKIPSAEIPDFDKLRLVQVKLRSDLKPESDSEIILRIDAAEGDKNYYWQTRPLIHFYEDRLGTPQTGYFNYIIRPFPDQVPKKLSLIVIKNNYKSPIEDLEIAFWMAK